MVCGRSGPVKPGGPTDSHTPTIWSATPRLPTFSNLEYKIARVPQAFIAFWFRSATSPLSSVLSLYGLPRLPFLLCNNFLQVLTSRNLSSVPKPDFCASFLQSLDCACPPCWNSRLPFPQQAPECPRIHNPKQTLSSVTPYT